MSISRQPKKAVPWHWVLTGVLLAAALLTAVLVLWPGLRRVEELESAIAREIRTQEMLQRIIDRRPGLEADQASLEQELAQLRTQVPGEGDFPLVITALKQAVGASPLTATHLDYGSVRSQGERLWIPVYLELTGDLTGIAVLLDGIAQSLPSARLGHFSLTSTAEGDVAFAGDLAIDLGPEPNRRPVTIAIDTLFTPADPFNRPHETLRRFFRQDIEVLGIISREGVYRALLAVNGERQWVNPGDALRFGFVAGVEAAGIVVELDGIQVELPLGGNQR